MSFRKFRGFSPRFIEFTIWIIICSTFKMKQAICGSCSSTTLRTKIAVFGVGAKLKIACMTILFHHNDHMITTLSCWRRSYQLWLGLCYDIIFHSSAYYYILHTRNTVIIIPKKKKSKKSKVKNVVVAVSFSTMSREKLHRK